VEGLLLHLKDFLLEECPAFLDSFALYDCLSKGTLSTRLLNRPWPALWKSKVAVLLTPILTSPRIENYFKTFHNHYAQDNLYHTGKALTQASNLHTQGLQKA